MTVPAFLFCRRISGSKANTISGTIEIPGLAGELREYQNEGVNFLDVKNGELHRADFILSGCTPKLIEEIKARSAKSAAASIPELPQQVGLEPIPLRAAPVGSALRGGSAQ